MQYVNEMPGWMRAVERRLERLESRIAANRFGKDYIHLAQAGTPDITNNANPHIVVRWSQQDQMGASLERFAYGVRVLRSGLYAIEGQAAYEITSSSQTFRSITTLAEVTEQGGIVDEWVQKRGERSLSISTPAITYDVHLTRWCDAGLLIGMTVFQQGQSVIVPYVNNKQFYLRVTRIG